ncbi:DUF2608 domain-containing protein [Rickettsia endosymbiont of Ceutorhynchus obstrictus]|uniref:DUF2608 domain-containing protein n=1 Tax=Rickettsia endosymbiont of Ceutorhynchus obstrictus TaxID=3066249 RepID=UPI003132D784
MIKLLKILLLSLICLSYNCFAEIIPTNDFKVIEEYVNKADKDTLVIFDVDDVLMMPTDEFAVNAPIRKELTQKLKERYSKDELTYLYSCVFEKRTVQPVNSNMKDLINRLEQRNIPAIALTGWWTGKFGKITEMENLRFDALKQLDISFINTSPFKENMTFPELKNKGGIPMLKSGVILTALVDKGLVLKSALAKSNLHFKKIIFIDDDLKYLESVEKVCHELNIDFKGIHYGAAKIAPLPILDKEKEQLRYEILEKEHIWLLDKELEERFLK